jgi:hypothetical protein
MRNFRSAIASALLTLAAWTATANPSQADTGTVHVLFSKAGVIAAVGNGKGELAFHGKKYLFEVSGSSLGATLGLTVSEFVGRALNLRTPGDLAGTYTAAGAGAALGAGAGAVRLRKANGVVLVLHGPKLGAELSASLARVTITMK